VIKLKEIPIPDNMTKFSAEIDTIRFNTVGIYNTHRSRAFYRIMATVCGHSFLFNQVEWPAITQMIWRFSQDDVSLGKKVLESAKPYSSIIYQIQR
jgi:hypothetical protein